MSAQDNSSQNTPRERKSSSQDKASQNTPRERQSSQNKASRNKTSRNKPRDRKTIEAEIRDTRSRLDETLHALEYKLSPQQLLNETFDYVRHGGPNEFANNFGNTIKQNPTPFLLTTVGLGWLMIAQRNPQRVGSTGNSSLASGLSDTASSARGAASTARDKTERAGQQAKDAGQRASDKASAAKSRLEERGNRLQEGSRAAVDRTSHRARATGNQAVRFIEDNPLAAAAIGIAIGAALGGLAPSTRKEDEQLGHMRDRFVDKASDVGLEQADKAQSKVEEKSEQAKEKAPAPSGTSDSSPSEKSSAFTSGAAAPAKPAAQSSPATTTSTPKPAETGTPTRGTRNR